MPPAAPSSALLLIWGDDEFAVKQRARAVHQQWCAELGGMDHETIDAQAGNSGEALRALAKLREALQTLPFFGGGKAIWFQGCSFLGDDRTSASRDVTESLAELASELKTFPWGNVRLLITAGEVDKRRTFYKTIEKTGAVETFAAWKLDDKNWTAQAETLALKALRAAKKEISDEALAELITRIGPHARQLASEVEKLLIYAGERAEIELGDVQAIVTRNKQARAFALADAVADRDLPRVLRNLDEEFWEMKFDKDKSEIGLLYGIISKIRALILLKEMLREKWLSETTEYARFKTQLERLPVEQLPEDKRYNPQGMHPFILFKALPQTRRYSLAELVGAMDQLLSCNRRLVSSSLDARLVLQQTLVGIVRGAGAPPVPRAA